MFHTMDGRKVVENLEEFDDAREVRALPALPQRPPWVCTCAGQLNCASAQKPDES